MKSLLTGLLLLVAVNANSAVINFDEVTSPRLDTEFLVSGENTHVDTSTGLEWLDFGTHEGAGVTYNWSLNNAALGFAGQGFRPATESEVTDLFSFFYTDFVDSGNGTMTVAEDPALDIIQERNSWLVGFGTDQRTTGSSLGDSLYSTGMYLDDDGSIQLAGFKIFLGEDGVDTTFYSTDYTVGFLDANTGYNNLGVFMVRDTDRGLCNPNLEACDNNVVPIPAAVWLFGSGLLGLVAVARRKA